MARFELAASPLPRECATGCATSASKLAEAAGFEPAGRLSGTHCLAGSCLGPLGHASMSFHSSGHVVHVLKNGSVLRRAHLNRLRLHRPALRLALDYQNASLAPLPSSSTQPTRRCSHVPQHGGLFESAAFHSSPPSTRLLSYRRPCGPCEERPSTCGLQSTVSGLAGLRQPRFDFAAAEAYATFDECRKRLCV